MRLLLDTHVWLWMLSGEERLSTESRTILADPENELFLSAAAVWEIAIKHAAGKLRYSGSPATQIPIHIKRSGVRPLAISRTMRSRQVSCHCTIATHSIG